MLSPSRVTLKHQRSKCYENLNSHFALEHRYVSQEEYDDLLRGCPEASILIETTGTWKTGHIRKRVTDSRWHAVDIYNGQFLKHEDHEEIWFDLGSVRYVVDRCDECVVDETPCLTFALVSNSSHLRSDAENVQSYVCGMSSAYVALTEIVLELNGHNWAIMSHVYHVAARSKNVLVLSSCESISVFRYALFHVALGLVDNNKRTSSLEIAFSNAHARSRCNTVTSSLTALVEKLFLDVSIFERYPEHEKTFDTVVLTDRSFHDDEYSILQAARYLIVSRRHVWFNEDDAQNDVLSSVPSYSVEDPPFEFRGDAYRRSTDDDETEFVVLSVK